MSNYPKPSLSSTRSRHANKNIYSTNRTKPYKTTNSSSMKSSTSSNSMYLAYSNNSIRRSLRLHYRRLSSSVSSQPSRKMALLIFGICTITSITVIFNQGNAHVDYLYHYYDATNNNIYNNNYGNVMSQNLLDIDNNDPRRQRAIQSAKQHTKDWIELQRQDEVDLDGIIKTFKSQLKKLEQDELEEKRVREAEKEEIEAESAYYLYYQDDNDSTSTVIGLPSQNQSSDPMIFKRFVGSLRMTGFGGNIIIGVEATVGDDLVEYLNGMDVIIKYLTPVECTFEFAKKNQKCYHPYSHIKREWSYFPLARDWLSSCESCVGSVVIASVRDTVFQLNPFGKGMPIISRLHIYEVHPSIVAAQTSAGALLKACDNIDLDKIDMDLHFYPEMSSTDPKRLRILSAGTAVGTRDDVIDYMGSIHSVMREWMQRSQCHFEHSNSDDGMAIVNYLRLKHRLPYRTRIIPHRTGIVNNVGFEGQNVHEAHLHFWEFKGLTEEEASKMAYEGAEGEGWIDTEYLLTNSDGQFIDIFFQKSAIIYEYNAFGTPFTDWFDKRLTLSSLAIKGEGNTTDSSINKGDDSAINGGSATDAGSLDGGSKNITDTTDVDSTNVDNNDTDTDIKEKNDNDDYYIKKDEVEISSNNTSTSPLNTERKVDNASDNSTKTEVEVKKEDQQPMYYRDPENGTNETNSDRENGGDGSGDNMDDNDDDDEEKSTQVVPVEEIKSKDEEEDKEEIKEERLALKKDTTQEGVIVV